MICRMVLSLTTPEDFSLPASFGSVSKGRRISSNQTENFLSVGKDESTDGHLLATTNSSGRSLASFSFTASEMGPKITTGLLKPAEPTTSEHQYKQTGKYWKILQGSQKNKVYVLRYLLVTPPSRRRGTVWWPAPRSYPLGSYGGLSSSPPSDLSTSRSLLCRCPRRRERRSGRWPSVLPWRQKQLN